MTRFGAPLLFLFFIAIGASGCKSCTKNSADADAAVDAAPVLATGPWTAAPVVRALGQLTINRRPDDGLIIRSGLYIYFVAANGTSIERIGKPADYAPFFPPAGDEQQVGQLVGYGARVLSHGLDPIRGLTTTRPFLGTIATGILTWNGSAWVKTAEAPPMGESDPWFGTIDSPDAGAAANAAGRLPSNMRWGQHRTTKRGHVVWIGQDETIEYANRHDDTVVLLRADAGASAAVAQPIAIPPLNDPNAAHRSCAFLEAVDDNVYLTCTTVIGDRKYDSTVYKLEEEGGPLQWQPLTFLRPPPEDPNDVYRSYAGSRAETYVVDREGSFWLERELRRFTHVVVRISKDGKTTEEFPLKSLNAWGGDFPTAHFNPASASFRVKAAVGLSAEPREHSRVWSFALLRSHHRERQPEVPEQDRTNVTVRSIVARRSGDIWVTADSSGAASSYLLFRFTRSMVPPTAPPDAGADVETWPTFLNARPPTPVVVLRSAMDQQIEALNAMSATAATAAPRAWAGHCSTVFVPFPTTASKDTVSAAKFYEAHKDAITEAHNAPSAAPKSKERPSDAYVIEGSINERHVAGVLFIQASPETTEAGLEKTVSKVAEVVTDNPASPPAITCSIPLVDHVIATLKSSAFLGGG